MKLIPSERKPKSPAVKRPTPISRKHFAKLCRKDGLEWRKFVPVNDEWDHRQVAFCRRCTAFAHFTVITHAIWDGPWNGTGSGVERRIIPHCRTCGGCPQEHRVRGRPIRIRPLRDHWLYRFARRVGNLLNMFIFA